MDIKIIKGKTYSDALRMEQSTLVYAPVTAISKAGGSPLITATLHGMPDGWRCAVVCAAGMDEINAINWPLKDSDWQIGTVVDGDHVELNAINAACFTPYTSGGFLVYRAPMNMTGFAARMQIKDKIGGVVLEELTTSNGKIVIDVANCKITRTLTAAATELYTWKKGVFDLELVDASIEPVVTLIDSGKVVVEGEVTTP